MLIGCRHGVMMLAESYSETNTNTLTTFIRISTSFEQQNWFSKLQRSAALLQRYLRKLSHLKQVNSAYEACESDVCFAVDSMPASFHVACDKTLAIQFGQMNELKTSGRLLLYYLNKQAIHRTNFTCLMIVKVQL